MEQIKSNLNNSIQAYESLYGPLTDAYPFDYEVSYKSNHYDTANSSEILLRPDRTFTSTYCIAQNGEGDYVWAYYKANGKYTYSASERVLTLHSDSIALENSHQGIIEEFNSSDYMKKLFDDTFKNLIIPNFFWGLAEFEFPRMAVPRTSEDPKEWDLSLSFIDYLTVCTDNNKLLALNDSFNTYLRIKTEGKHHSTTITENMVYDTLTLRPNGTFKLFDYTSSWDRDGCYTWDSDVSCEGSWEYNAETRTIKLTYGVFNCNEHKQNPRIIEGPSEHVTNNFYFEGNFIYSASVGWTYGRFERIKGLYLKKK